MTLVLGLLALGDRETQRGFLATNVAVMTDGHAATDPVFNTSAPLDHERWTSIVIHDLGTLSGDPDTVHRQHLSYGYQGLGYHFVIGNGHGMGDGVIHAGYRWNEQLPGVHTAGENADYHNQRSIGIVLVGNGERRPFTDRQMASLVNLIQRLQRELDIPASRVYLHRDVAEGASPPVTSPGRFFARSQLHDQIR
jgi:N-acetyl-anhydromuramyl-L-alanine amidase AmpD